MASSAMRQPSKNSTLLDLAVLRITASLAKRLLSASNAEMTSQELSILVLRISKVYIITEVGIIVNPKTSSHRTVHSNRIQPCIQQLGQDQ